MSDAAGDVVGVAEDLLGQLDRCLQRIGRMSPALLGQDVPTDPRDRPIGVEDVVEGDRLLRPPGPGPLDRFELFSPDVPALAEDLGQRGDVLPHRVLEVLVERVTHA
jgi:hypothetical protein